MFRLSDKEFWESTPRKLKVLETQYIEFNTPKSYEKKDTPKKLSLSEVSKIL